ncbi:MAG TPA: hypothetical protein VGW34_02265 [Allosphingosinicella sp.]|nr:hypothetical protein [Allosphingosinicella sp.]
MEGVAWIAAITLATASAAAPLPPVEETACAALVDGADGTIAAVDDPDLRVLEQTRATGKFAYSRENTRAIRCLRSDLVPVVNDFKVLRAGYPLYIVSGGTGANRMGVLELSTGQFRFRILQGELTPNERHRLLLRLNEIQEAARAAR